jgi:hypothetical protein
MAKKYFSSLLVQTTLNGENHEQIYTYFSDNLIELQMSVIKKYIGFFTNPVDRILHQLNGGSPHKSFTASMIGAFVSVSGGYTDHFSCSYEFNDDLKIIFELRAGYTVTSDDYADFELLFRSVAANPASPNSLAGFVLTD